MKRDSVLATLKPRQFGDRRMAEPGAVPARQIADAGDLGRRQANDSTGVSAQPSDSAFAEAARLYDPRSLTRAQMLSMAALLLGHGAISDRDQLILQTDPTAGRMAVARDLAAPRNAIKDWQERRAIDMELGRIQAVEASTRALAILGRVTALRIDPSGG